MKKVIPVHMYLRRVGRHQIWGTCKKVDQYYYRKEHISVSTIATLEKIRENLARAYVITPYPTTWPYVFCLFSCEPFTPEDTTIVSGLNFNFLPLKKAKTSMLNQLKMLKTERRLISLVSCFIRRKLRVKKTCAIVQNAAEKCNTP